MIVVAGGGAFGTALALALSRGDRPVMLWSRRLGGPAERLRGVDLSAHLRISADPNLLREAEVVLVAVPMQQLRGFLSEHASRLGRSTLVLCCKGIDLESGQGPVSLAAACQPDARLALLTGPSFAADIASGLPTALTLACGDAGLSERLQGMLSTPLLRLYRTTDVTGAELGGALKNVVAIAAGVTIGAGLGQSARAALMTRGYAEMVRFARTFGARAETLAGLSGLGDLVLTCTSEQSRNFSYGMALGSGRVPEPGVTVEGVATSRAAVRVAGDRGIEMPVAGMVAALCEGAIPLSGAIDALMSRPLKEEQG
jgi:glycerol-3-phosphate dehydrogenase (NAD(P)+)